MVTLSTMVRKRFEAFYARWDRGEKKLLRNFTPTQKKLWHIWTFLLRFYLVTFPLYFAASYLFDGTFFQQAVASLVATLLSFTGIAVDVVNSIVFHLPEYNWSIQIVRDCVGWKSILALSGLILAVKNVKMRIKMRGIISAIPVIFFINITRIYTSIVLATIFGTHQFSLIHDVLWQVTLAVMIVGMWLFWLKENHLHPLFGSKHTVHWRLSKPELSSLKLFISRKV